MHGQLPAAGGVGSRGGHLEVHGTPRGKDQRPFQGDLLQVRAAGAVTGLEGEFHEGAAGHQDDSRDGVVGQPGVGGQGEAAGQRDGVGGGQGEGGAEHRVPGG